MNDFARMVKRSKQRGALAVTTPLIILLIFMLTVLLLDGARLYAIKRSMQSVANAAAAAAADLTQACAGYELDNEHAIGAAAESGALAAGKSELGGTLTLVQPGVLIADSGRWQFKKFEALVNETNAVKVVYTLSTPVSSLLPGLLGNLEMQAAAVARKEAVATVSAAGSTAIIGGDSETAGLLGRLLGAILTDGDLFALDPTDLNSLASTTFQLDGFLSKLGVADLIEGADRIVPVTLALEAVLAGLGEGAGAAGDVLDRMLSVSAITTNVRLGDVLRGVGSLESPEEIRVPVYDMVVALLLNTLSGNVLELPFPLTVNVDLADSVVVDLQLAVGDAPSVLIAPARFYPDGRPMLEFKAADLLVALKVKVSVPALAEIYVPLLVETGGGTGYLAYADCASGVSNDVLLGFRLDPKAVEVSTKSLQPNGAPMPDALSVQLAPALAGLLTLSVSANLAGLEIGSTQSVIRELTYDLYSNEPVRAFVSSGIGVGTVGAGLQVDATVNLGGATNDCRGLLSWLTCKLGDLLNPLLDGLVSELTEVAIEGLVEDVVIGTVNEVTTTLLEPLLRGLGVNLGGMAVDVSHVGQGQVVILECFQLDCEWEGE